MPYTTITEDTTKIVEEAKEVQDGTDKVPKMVKKEVENTEGDITFYSIFYYPNNYACEDYNNGKEPGGPTAALANIFENGLRSNKTYGYELGQGGTGMTYNGTYYYRCPRSKNAHVVRDWYYPVDSRVSDEDLVNKERYKDMQDFGLNANFYGDFWGKDIPESGIKEYLNQGNSLSDSPNLTLAKSLVNATEKDNKYFIPAQNFYKNLATVIKKFDEETNKSYSYEIDIQGFASSHGYVPSNKILAENRALVIEKWIRELNIFDFGANGNAKISHNGNGQVQETNTATESDFKPKAARAAVVSFKLIPSKTKIEEVQENEEVPHYEEKIFSSEENKSSYKEIYDTSKSDDYVNDTYDNEYTYFKQINENDVLGFCHIVYSSHCKD